MYVVKTNGEGYVKDYTGIKSEKDYYSLTMQPIKNAAITNATTAPNGAQRLLSSLTQYVRAIRPGTEADCNTNPPFA